MKRPPIVIVGASLAGGTAAVTLREEGFDGDIVLIGAESQLPYNRPPLSKGYLRGQDRFDDQLVKPASYYAEQRIQLKLGVRATAIDPKQKLVELEGGERVVYDRLLVTTGGRNRTLTVPGANLAGVFQLRTVQDCDRIRAAVAPGRRAAVIGFSFIGSEVSASLRQLGVEVVAIEGSRVPLARVLGDEAGQVLAAIHREKGVELITEDSVDALEGSGHVARVRTRKNRVFECDLVVAGIGIVPNAELLAAAGAQVDNGVLVDEYCRTSLPDVFAAGDVTNHLHPIFRRPRLAVKSHEVVPPGPHCEAGGCESTITAAKEARVDIHKNARTTAWSRAEIIRQVREVGQSIRAVARAFHVTPKTARTWVRRADERLSDRSSRPHHVPGATPPELVGEVERLRRQRWTAVEIAARLQLGRSTVARIVH